MNDLLDTYVRLLKEAADLRVQLPDDVLAADQARCMADLWKVGPEKPLGYLPLSTIGGYCGESAARVKSVLKARGLDVRVFHEECLIDAGAGALYAFDPAALQRLLDENLATLLLAAWPTRAADFVRKVASGWICARRFPALYTVIARAFGRQPEPYEFE